MKPRTQHIEQRAKNKSVLNRALSSRFSVLGSQSGFTLIELLVVIGIMAVLVGAGGLSLSGVNHAQRVENVKNQIVTLLRTAQQRALSQELAVRWGVYLDNTGPGPGSFTLFSVDDLLANDPLFIGQPGTTTQRTSLSGGVRFFTPAFGTSTSVIFERGTGLPATTTVVLLGSVASVPTSTIVVETNGRIEY